MILKKITMSQLTLNKKPINAHHGTDDGYFHAVNGAARLARISCKESLCQRGILTDFWRIILISERSDA